MAVSKTLASATFSIEVENGTDKKGVVIYKKRTYPAVKKDAAPQNVYDTAEAIKAVLSSKTRDYFLNETSKLINA